MIMSLVSHIICAWFAFLIPSYSTFKALSHRPLSEPELERWAMYWSVVGAFVAFEYVAEWLASWLPFYWEVKTLVLLFLALPQTQGSTFVYNTYLRPFFSKNEADLDDGISAVQRNALTFLQTRLSGLWELASNRLNKTHPSTQSAAPTGSSNAPNGISLQSAIGLFQAYAPSALGGLKAHTQAKSAPNINASSTAAAAFQPERSTPQAPQSDSAPPPFPEPQHF
jgi:receptor expression-enhancing protein 1/2/3/4